MNAILLAAIGLGAFALGYRFYSKFIAEKLYRLSEDFVTPAHELEDGIDFVPTNRFVLWGHHFAAVAGAAPILGPAIAVIWGWLPAFLWVTLGTVFFAGIHDFGALWASVRHKGQSIGALTETIVGKRARNVFMIVIFLLLLMVNATFAIIIGELFVSTPSSVIPVWAVLPVAMAIGWGIYRKGLSLVWVTAIGVIVLYGTMFVGDAIPLELPAQILGYGPEEQWVMILFIYAAIASILPVWLLLQPRDYINGIQLFVGLAVLYTAVLIANPTIVAPAINPNPPAGTDPLIPLLFVTIACGAISGFHGLVASGTTSKQLNKETDARFVGYLGSTGEGILALASIIACTAGFATTADWTAFYSSGSIGGGMNGWVQGGGALVAQGLGLPAGFAGTLLAVMAILFAATTMDAGVRLQRYIVQEWGQIYGLKFLTGRYLSTLVVVLCCVGLAFGVGEGGGSGGRIIWPLFGTTNQLLGALTLLVLSTLLMKLGRPVIYTLAPLSFLLVMTIWALIFQLRKFYDQGNYFLVGVDLIILGAAIWVALEALGALARARKEGLDRKAAEVFDSGV
ncbi:MAG: carbon starvation protein A [Gemmatimonadota bacterium]